jgi:hypothetical protein
MKTPEEFAYELWDFNLASGGHPDYLDEVITRLTAWRDECVEHWENKWKLAYRDAIEAQKERDAAQEACRMMQDRLQRLIDAKEAKE